MENHNFSDLKVPLIDRAETNEELGHLVDSANSAAAVAASPSSSSKSGHPLGFGALVFLIYYNIGVPFGDEGAVKAAGPFMVNLGFFVLLPILWQIPICLITAELATTFPDHRGSVAWVSEAFGAQWGFIDAVWSLSTSFLDTALFPLIIADFLELSGPHRWLFVYLAVVLLTWAVYRGSAVVASAEEIVFVLTLLPIVVMVGLGLFKMDWVLATTPPALDSVDWKSFIQIMFWTSTYWQKVASVGPNVKDCSKIFPRAILYACGMQILINGSMHFVAAGATDPAQYPQWSPGYIRMAVNAIAGGEWLGTWITVMSAVSNSGSFLSEMSVTSQTLVGMSERGFLPKKMMAESRHGTYPWALGTIAVIIAISQPLDFKELVLVCNFLYTLQTGLELLAFYRLRIALPDRRRPFRVPGGSLGVVLAIGFPMVTLVAVITTVRASAAGVGIAIALGTVVASQVMFRSRFARGYGLEESVAAARDDGDVWQGMSLNRDVPRGGGGMIWEVKVPSGPAASREEGDMESIVVVGGGPLNESQTSRSGSSSSDEDDEPVGADSSEA